MAGNPIQSRVAISTTDWSLVRRAADVDGEVKRLALSAMLARYRPALVLHLRSRFGLDDECAEEYVQEFIVGKVIEQNLVGRANKERGRFRSFLLTALDCYTIDRLRKLKQQGS